MRNWASQGFSGGFVLGDIEPPDPRWGQALINAGLSKTLIELLNRLRHIFNLAVFDKVFIGA
jgi:hypothetical protein